MHLPSLTWYLLNFSVCASWEKEGGAADPILFTFFSPHFFLENIQMIYQHFGETGWLFFFPVGWPSAHPPPAFDMIGAIVVGYFSRCIVARNKQTGHITAKWPSHSIMSGVWLWSTALNKHGPTFIIVVNIGGGRPSWRKEEDSPGRKAEGGNSENVEAQRSDVCILKTSAAV